MIRIFYLIALASVLLVSPLHLKSQNMKLGWNSFNSGARQSKNGQTIAKSVIGQFFAGKSENNNTSVSGGFLVNEALTGIVGVKYEKLNFRVNVYPNPFSSILNIDFRNPGISTVSIDLINILGKRIANIAGNLKINGDHKFNINMTDYIENSESGIYFLKMIIKNENGIENLYYKLSYLP